MSGKYIYAVDRIDSRPPCSSTFIVYFMFTIVNGLIIQQRGLLSHHIASTLPGDGSVRPDYAGIIRSHGRRRTSACRSYKSSVADNRWRYLLSRNFNRTAAKADDRSIDTKSGDESDERGAAEAEVEAEAEAAGAEGTEGAGGGRFEVGDLVWGPVKGYASWPGKLRARAHGGRWAVRWFGAERAPAAPSAVHHSRLLTLSEGLEAHHAARTKHRK